LGLIDKIDGMRKIKRSKNKHMKIKADTSIADIAREVRKEQEAEKLEKEMDTPDYDSTYIKPR